MINKKLQVPHKKWMFSIKDFFSVYEDVRKFLYICSNYPLENFIFCPRRFPKDCIVMFWNISDRLFGGNYGIK